ncbi:hypothetical protein V8C37DRAFT_374604 [Trichoderma ceciliae]
MPWPRLGLPCRPGLWWPLASAAELLRQRVSSVHLSQHAYQVSTYSCYEYRITECPSTSMYEYAVYMCVVLLCSICRACHHRHLLDSKASVRLRGPQ